MSLLHSLTCRRCLGRALAATALVAPFGSLFGRKLAAQQSREPTQGGALSTRSHVLDTGADAMQVKRPIDAMSEFLNGFHFYADDMGRQIEANHFCTHLTEEFHQCVIYDSNRSDAKLIGIEYIVSERIFLALPDDEKRLWHSHHYEVKSGQLIAPGVPELAEHAFMSDLVTTYGKTWHTWQIDRYADLPMGIPQLMMGFTRDGQIDPAMLGNRDKRFDRSSEERRKNRDDIATPAVAAGANAWQSGHTVQLTLRELEVRHRKM